MLNSRTPKKDNLAAFAERGCPGPLRLLVRQLQVTPSVAAHRRLPCFLGVLTMAQAPRVVAEYRPKPVVGAITLESLG